MNKNVLVTGSGRGIGRGIALELAKAGYTLVLNGKGDSPHLRDTLQQVREYSPGSIAYPCDVSDYEATKEMLEHIHREIGEIYAVINNAGISHIGLFNEMTPLQWQELISTNINAMFNCCHLTLPHMIHEKQGCIVNISSMWGISGASCEAVYSATKGAVNAFTKALGKELAPSNIFVNAIACGAIDTSMNSFLSPEERQALWEEIPLGRFGTPEEVGKLVLYLVRDNTYITGQVISLDGGMI